MKQNMTTGSVMKNMIVFSLPYLLSTFLQTLYGLADLFIIGQFDGVAGTTAVSIGSQVMHMLTVMIVGLAMGATVRIGRAVGAKDDAMARESVGNTATLFMGFSVAATCLLLLGVNGILALLSTPEEAVSGTRAYLTVCFIGIPCITAYNIISSIFRGMGDSKSPMIFVAIACAANIALDVFFMGTLKLGPVGAELHDLRDQLVGVVGVAVVAAVGEGLPHLLTQRAVTAEGQHRLDRRARVADGEAARGQALLLGHGCRRVAHVLRNASHLGRARLEEAALVRQQA